MDVLEGENGGCSEKSGSEADEASEGASTEDEGAEGEESSAQDTENGAHETEDENGMDSDNAKPNVLPGTPSMRRPQGPWGEAPQESRRCGHEP